MVCRRVYCIQHCLISSMKRKEWNFEVCFTHHTKHSTLTFQFSTSLFGHSLEIFDSFLPPNFSTPFVFTCRSIIFGYSTKSSTIPSAAEQFIEPTASTNFNHTSTHLIHFFDPHFSHAKILCRMKSSFSLKKERIQLANEKQGKLYDYHLMSILLLWIVLNDSLSMSHIMDFTYVDHFWHWNFKNVICVVVVVFVVDVAVPFSLNCVYKYVKELPDTAVFPR